MYLSVCTNILCFSFGSVLCLVLYFVLFILYNYYNYYYYY